MEQVKPIRNTHRVSLGLRITAAAMAALLLCSLVLLDAIRIDINQQEYEGTNAEAAAGNYLAGSTEYVQKSTLERAAQVVGDMLKKPVTLQDYYDLASEKIAKAEYDDALTLTDVCLEMVEASSSGASSALYVDLLMKKGCLLALQNDYVQALTYFDRVIGLDSTQAQAHLLKAQIYAEQKKNGEAIGSLNAYLALQPQDYSMRTALIQLYYVNGEYNLAEQACDDYLSLTYDSTGAVYFLRGACRLQRSGYEPAMEDLLTAAQRGYQDPGICYGQAAICAYLLGKSELVLQYGQQAVSLGSSELDFGTLYSYMGYSSMLLKRFTDAEAQFTSAMGNGQPEAPMRYYRGVSRMAQSRAADAVEDFSAAIDGGETTAQCYYNRGACYLQLGENEKALADMKAVVSLNEDAELTAIAGTLIEQLEKPA